MMGRVLWHLLDSTVFTCLVAFLALVCKKHGAATRHLLWLIAAIKFALPTIGLAVVGRSFRMLWGPEKTFSSSFYLPGSSIFIQPRHFLPTASTTDIFGQILCALWVIGTLCSIGVWWKCALGTKLLVSDALSSEVQAISRLQHRIELRRTVRIQSTSARIAPFLSGIWYPVVTIPHGLSASLAPGEFEAVLLHELFHAKRWDNLAGTFVHALFCVFWFYPLIWWIERRMTVERELACDEAVIACGSPGNEYMSGLLAVCQFCVLDSRLGTCGIKSSNLKKRMELIISYSSKQPVHSKPKLLLTMLATAAALIPLGIGFFQTSGLYGQGGNRIEKPVSCLFDGKGYLEGAVIEQREGGRQQMCVQSSSGQPMWVRTAPAVRDRSSAVVVLPVRHLPTSCEPKSSSSRLCLCQESDAYSPGSIVNSAKGRLTCASGTWRPASAAELGLK